MVRLSSIATLGLLLASCQFALDDGCPNGSCPAGSFCGPDGFCHPGSGTSTGTSSGGSSSSGSGSTTTLSSGSSGGTGTTVTSTAAGSSSSGSGSSGSNSSGSSSSSGSSGAPPLFTFACDPPTGNTWPTSCQPEVLAVDLRLTQQLNADDVAIVGTGDGGFLLAVTGGWGSFVQYVAVAPGQSSQDAGWLDCTSGACPASTIAFVPGAPGKPPTLVGGFQPAGMGGQFSPSQIACWAPFSGLPTTPLAIPNGGGADQVSPALSADGQLGVAVMDFENSVFYDGFGDGGGCPTSLSVVTSTGTATANGVSLVSTGQPASSGADFVIGEAIENSNNFETELGLVIEPDGGLVQQGFYGSSGNSTLVTPLVLASDGVTVYALTADVASGIQLFAYALPGFQEIFDGGVVAPQPNAAGPAVANCGPDCMLATWTYEADGGDTTPSWAVMNAEGCGAGGLLTPIATAGGALNVSFVATAYEAGLGVIAVAYTIASSTCGLGTCIYDTRVYVSFCTP